FIPNQFSITLGTRLYRTGDRVRWIRNGKLEFLGRIDQQVKVRGYRIELGEIESVLQGHPEVEQAVVVVRGEGEGGKQLIGYVVQKDGAAAKLEIAGIREYLRGRLPEYMVPGGWVVLEELPLTPNGKVDRKGLPEPEWGEIEEEGDRLRTAEEEIVRGMFAEVLKRERGGEGQ